MLEWILIVFAVSDGPTWKVAPVPPGPRDRPPGVAMASVQIPGFASEKECAEALKKILDLAEPNYNVAFMGARGACISRTK